MRRIPKFYKPLSRQHARLKAAFCALLLSGSLYAQDTTNTPATSPETPATAQLSQDTTNTPAASPETPATADLQMEEIIVTGEYFSRALTETPGSVSVVAADALQEQEARHLDQAFAAIPNLNYASGAARPRFFQIRGIGERQLYVQSANYSVGVLADELDVTQYAGAAALFDVQQVEVLRGPQGTRQGANAIAGLILLRSRSPSVEWQGQAHIGVGDYGGRSVEVGVGGALTARAGVRLSTFSERSDGYYRNKHLGLNDVNGIDERGSRIKGHWDVSSNVQLRVLSLSIRNKNGYDAFTLDNSRVTLSDQPGKDDLDYRGTAVELLWDNPRASVSLRTSRSRADVDYGYDEDWIYQGFCKTRECSLDEYSSTDYYLRDYTSKTYEVRVRSTEAGRWFNGTTLWLLGAYQSRSDTDLRRVYTFLSEDYLSSTEDNSQAFFIELQSELGANLRLIAGYRRDAQDTDFADNADLNLRLKDTLWGARAVLDWAVQQGRHLYLQYARGYKRSGVNYERIWLTPQQRSYRAEALESVEMGLRTASADGRVNARVTAFRMHRHHPQLSASLVFQRDDGTNDYVDYFANAPYGRNLGLELELDWQVNDRIDMNYALGLLKSYYGALTFSDTYGSYSVEGRAQAHAPSVTAQASLQWQPQSLPQWALQVTGQYRGGFYFSDSSDVRASASTQLHWRLRWKSPSERYTAALWMRNAADGGLYTHGFYFGNDPRNGYAAQRYVQRGEPRHFGMSVRMRIDTQE